MDATTTTTMTPHRDLAAERALLGCIILDASCIDDDTLALVRPNQMGVHANGIILQTIQRMRADGAPIDLVTVGSAILDARMETEIGGLGYLQILVDAAPAAANCYAYAIAIRNAATRRATERATGKADGSTVVSVIIGYLQMRYQPVCRRGAAIVSQRLGRDIQRAEACAAPTSDLIPALMAATDYPCDQQGRPRGRDSAPGVYRRWAPTAWADLLAGLPDESDTAEIADAACEEFGDGLASLLSSIVTLGRNDREGQRSGGEHPQQQARSMIDWCRVFARPGPWRDIRSYAIWCRLDGEGRLEVAIHHRLYAQLRRSPPVASHRRLAELCEHYGVGRAGRTSKSRLIELSRSMIDDLLLGPCDGACDDDGDAAPSTCAAEAASPSSSHAPSREADSDT